MTAPERRRPLPALAFIGALTLLTALVWFRVIHRDSSSAMVRPTCAASTSSARVALPTVLPVAKNVSVAVLNSTQRDGIARATKKALTKIGFTVTVATDDGPQYGGHGLIKGTGEIRYGSQALAAATLVHYYLPMATMVADDSTSAVVRLSLGAKFTILQTPKQVTAELAKAGRRLTTKPIPTTAPTSSAPALCAPATDGASAAASDSASS